MKVTQILKTKGVDSFVHFATLENGDEFGLVDSLDDRNGDLVSIKDGCFLPANAALSDAIRSVLDPLDYALQVNKLYSVENNEIVNHGPTKLLRGIEFEFDAEEGIIDFKFSVNFDAYMASAGDFEATLVLPSTENTHVINGAYFQDSNAYHLLVLEQLTMHFFESFPTHACAAAAGEVGFKVDKVIKVDCIGTEFYVTHSPGSDNSDRVLVESPFRKYYNKKYLFEQANYYDLMVGPGHTITYSDVIKQSKLTGKSI